MAQRSVATCRPPDGASGSRPTVNGSTPQARSRALYYLDGFRIHVRDAGLGHISEIFDGDPPHEPRGCAAQVWSVAEVLRVLVEETLSPPASV